jgi:hypothetical protein
MSLSVSVLKMKQKSRIPFLPLYIHSLKVLSNLSKEVVIVTNAIIITVSSQTSLQSAAEHRYVQEADKHFHGTRRQRCVVNVD